MAGRVWWKSASNAWQKRQSTAFGYLAKGGSWSHITGQSLFFPMMPSSGELASHMLVAGTRREFDRIPEYIDDGSGELVRYPPSSASYQIDFGPHGIVNGYYTEGYQPTGVYDGEYKQAQGSFPPGNHLPHSAYPLNPYPEDGIELYGFDPQYAPIVGSVGNFNDTRTWWPQCLVRSWHSPSLGGFELFPQVQHDFYGTTTQTTFNHNLRSCCSFALPGLRKAISSPTPPGYANDTFEFWYGLRSRVMAVGSGRHAFIARIVFDYYIANPYIYNFDEAGDIFNRQYFIQSAHLVEDTFLLVHHQWKEIPVISAFEGLSLTFIVIGETPAQWQARTGVTFT